MHQTHDAQVTVILDAWTSSNGHAFLAIVARFVNKDFEIGESRLSLSHCGQMLNPFQKRFCLIFKNFTAVTMARTWPMLSGRFCSPMGLQQR
jgi:hypothetical protein